MSCHIAFTPDEHEALGLNPNFELECLLTPPAPNSSTQSEYRISTIMESIDNSVFSIDSTGFNRRMCGLYTAACHSLPDMLTHGDDNMPSNLSETTKQNIECLELLGKVLPQYAYLIAAVDPGDIQSVEKVNATILNCEKEDLEKMWGSVTVNPQQVWECPKESAVDERRKKKRNVLKRRGPNKKGTRRKSKRIVRAANCRKMETKREMRKRISAPSTRHGHACTETPVRK